MTRTSVAVVLLVAVTLAACARHAAPVSPELRAAVGRELSVDVSRIDPDQSLVTVKPDLDDIGTVALVLALEQTFNVDINDDAAGELLGASPHERPTKLTLNNLARLVATAPHVAPRPAAAAPPEARPSPAPR